MTDAPAATLPDPAQSPDSYIGPLVNLITQLSPAISTMAAQSGDVKTIVSNLGVAWVLPWLWWFGVVGGAYTGLVWLYRRALARRSGFALWFHARMPWNRTA